MMVTEQVEPLSLYVHWPFCASKCPYCDFNSHVSAEVDHGRWRAALVRELETQAADPRLRRRPLRSIFFGGGTPSLMQPDTAEAVINTARKLFSFHNDIEISLEANPTSVEAAKLDQFRLAGVNRISLGIQALNDDDLAFLGRTHSAEEAIAAIRVAQDCFASVSFDLIAARPNQTRAAWLAELERAVEIGTDHLSIYQLTIEPTTPFHALHARGAFTLPDEDLATELYEATGERLAELGLPLYEVSNHARPGHECRHNLGYWGYGDYLGIGPGAHGRLTQAADPRAKRATRTHRAPQIWLDRVERDGHALVDDAPIDGETGLAEATMMGLRTLSGMPRARWRALFDAEPETLFDADALGDLIEEGYLVLDDDGLRATAAGRLRLNAVTGHLLSARPQRGRDLI